MFTSVCKQTSMLLKHDPEYVFNRGSLCDKNRWTIYFHSYVFRNLFKQKKQNMQRLDA